MCRWLAYSGKSIFMDKLVTQPDHSLVQQSINSRMNFSHSGKLLSTNGDGFGLGWYGKRREPGVFKDDIPAWHDDNLHNICHQVKAHIFFAHVRASTTGDIQRSNCHPFQYRNWLFQHNGNVHHFDRVRQVLQGRIAPELFPWLRGSTDSETLFFLALTLGLEDDPAAGFRRMVETTVAALEKYADEVRINLSCALSDGEVVYILRYAINEAPMTLFYSTDADCAKDIADSDSGKVPTDSVVIVSEPLNRRDEKWVEIEDNSFGRVVGGRDVRIERFL